MESQEGKETGGEMSDLPDGWQVRVCWSFDDFREWLDRLQNDEAIRAQAQKVD